MGSVVLLLLHALLVLVAGQVDNNGDSDAAGEGESTPWECPRPGRFPNPADPSCRTYLTCAVMVASNGTRLLAPARQDECWPGALFSGRYQRCITGDDCATLEDFYSIEYECGECGKYVLESSTDCRHFVNCLKTRDPGVFVPIRQRCPDDRPLFSPPAHACVAEDEYECGGGGGGPLPPLPSLLSMTTTPAMAMTAMATTTTVTTLPTTDTGHYLSDLVCLGVGRFPDESVPHCRGYRLCTPAVGDDQGRAAPLLVSRSFLCEPGTVFSEYERRCLPATSYQCPEDDGTMPPPPHEPFRCVTVGRFPDREPGGRCRRFYRCQRAGDGSLKPPALEQCPPGTIFSWLTTRCVPPAEYVCPVVLDEPSMELPESDTSSSRSSFSRALARCTGPGDDEETGSADCGPVSPQEPRPATQSAVVGSVEQQTGAGSGDDGAPWLTWSATERLTADAASAPVTLDVDGGDLVLPTSALRPYTPPEYPCTATGRFADINSVDCRSYFLCKLLHQPPQPAADGSQQQQQQQHHNKQQQQQILVSVHMTCPEGMLFSRNTNKCVISNRHVC